MDNRGYFGIQAQLQFDDQLLTQVRMICLKGWERRNPPRKASVSFTQIKQSNGETYVDFIPRPHQNLTKTVSQPGLRDLLMQVLAYDNANSECKKATQPLKNISQFARILGQNRIKCNSWLKHCLRLIKRRI